MLKCCVRQRSKELEEFVITHLNSEADKLARRRSSVGTFAGEGPNLPSLLDEEADLDTISASFATVSMGLARLSGSHQDVTPTKGSRMSEISE